MMKKMKKWLKKTLSIISLIGAIYLIYINNSIGVVLLFIPILISLNDLRKIVKRKWNKIFVSRKYSNLYQTKYTRQSNYNAGQKDDELLNMYDVSF